MTCIILQDGSGLAKDQPCVAQHPSTCLVRVRTPSGHETEFTEDPSGHETEFAKDPPEVPRRRRTRKSHYIAPPSVPTNPESRPIIKPVDER
jgi:hypothetical protein